MNTEIKRHIDAARQVLVGVVPNPASQIDQITYALVYKFMSDMDQQAIKSGDEPAFFIGDLELYSWERLMSTTIGNQERMNLYVSAFQKFGESKQLPELFRNILKSAFLPYRSPETLSLFLKEIDYFDYSHPEDLGDAYEYLLSIMSSQGDAGQFRTPRHIINFIVDVVNPTKDDKVLDPACGTGGFLVSSYRHILEQHDSKSGSYKENKSLTPEERKRIMNNFEGYDIDPTMVRISQVNMYLHQFKNPKIFQYDTLSSDERWGDKFDVILANPPFMSPKGGIKPHSKFSIESSRSEVLFVDYIMNHLRPGGRAGIIVPEGIIFQSGKSHKELRKNLVNDGLYAVVSLPSGVFAPYSGVKTSILLFNNELARQSKEILFIKIEQDGFDLGAQRRVGGKNDLPIAFDVLSKWNIGEKVENKLVTYVEKAKIAENDDYNLSADHYRIATDYTNAKWPMVRFDDVISTIIPPVKISREYFKTNGSFPIIDQSQDEIAGWTNDESALVKSEKPLVIFGDHTCAVKYTDKPFAQGADGIKILFTSEVLIPKYFYYILKNKPIEVEGYQRHFVKLKRYKIPLPPLEIQEQIVAELDCYQNIIDGARKVVNSWKPKINIDPEWEKVRLGEVCNFVRGPFGGSLKKEIFVKKGYAVYEQSHAIYSDFTDFRYFIDDVKFVEMNRFEVKPGDLIMSCSGTMGKTAIIPTNARKGIINQALLKLTTKEWLNVNFLKIWMDSPDFQIQLLSQVSGAAIQNVASVKVLQDVIIPLPPLEIQKKIVGKIEAERVLVEGNKKLIENYNQKIKEVISNLWKE